MATSSSAPFNSVWGYTVGIPPIQVIDANGNITATAISAGVVSGVYGDFDNLSTGNLTVTGSLILPPNANIVGNITGNVRAPGADTQIMFNIGGNLAADPDFTWNPVTNFLHVMGNACFDGCVTASCFIGDGSQLTNVYALSANTVSSSAQPNITSLGNLTSLTVTGNSNLGNAANLRIGGGNYGDVLTSYGNGNVFWNSPSNTAVIANGTSNVRIPAQNGPVFISASNTANILAVYGPNTYVSNIWSDTPVVVANAEMWVSGNVRADHFDGDGSRLSNINAANIVGLPPTGLANRVADAAQPNIRSLGILTGLNVAGTSNLGPVGNVVITGGNAGEVLTTYGNGTLYWSNVSAATTLSQGNSNVIVYPNANVAISSNGVSNVFVVSPIGTATTGIANITGNVNIGGNLDVTNNALFRSNVQVSGVSNLGNVGNVIITGGTAGQYLQTNGAGNLVWANAPVSSLLSNGISNVAIPVADGNINLTAGGNTSLIVTPDGIVTNNITANSLTVANFNVGNTVGNVTGYFNGNVYDPANAVYPGFEAGYRDVPQIVLGGDVVLNPSAAGKHFYANSVAITDYTITIPENLNNVFAMGTEIQLVNIGLGNIIIRPDPMSLSPVTLYKAGNNISSARTITRFGIATLLKVDTDTWMIHGTGVV